MVESCIDLLKVLKYANILLPLKSLTDSALYWVYSDCATMLRVAVLFYIYLLCTGSADNLFNSKMQPALFNM